MVQASMSWKKEAWQRRPKTAYIDVKRMGKHAVWLAKSEVEKEEFTIVSADGDGVFRIAKQMDCRKQDIAGENCVRNDIDELALTDENQMKAWVEHYAGLLKVEFVWPSNELPEFIAVSLRSLQLMVHLPVCLRPRSAKHSAKWNAAGLLVHHREREIKFIGLFGDRGHRGSYSPYKPWNHNLYIGITIFPHR